MLREVLIEQLNQKREIAKKYTTREMTRKCALVDVVGILMKKNLLRRQFKL
jgi:hypothetical protein